MKLWQHCAQVTLSKAQGYVFKTANNRLLNEFDHQKVKLKFQNRSLTETFPEDPGFLLEQKEFGLRLESALAALPEKQRVVFLLSRIDKKTYREIADLLGISKQAVEKRMYNALDKLRVLSQKIK